jgi:hypothetical protein
MGDSEKNASSTRNLIDSPEVAIYKGFMGLGEFSLFPIRLAFLIQADI